MSPPPTDESWMERAVDLALEAKSNDEVPVGAVIVKDNAIIGKGFNRTISAHDPSAHAEIQAVRSAGKRLENHRLNDTVLYVTLEPCIMCAGGILQARIKKVVFGAFDQRYGAAGSQLNLLQSPFMNHRCEVVSGVFKERCENIISEYFHAKRKSSSPGGMT